MTPHAQRGTPSTARSSLLSLLLLPMVLVSGWQAERAAIPQLELRAGEPVLVLTTPMAAALAKFDPAFKVRRLADYPPDMWLPMCTGSPDCAHGFYRFNPREAPFAVVGDFNGDGILDAVMDGYNRDKGRRVVVLSTGQSFSASEIDTLGPASSTIMEFGLSWAKPAAYRTPYEPRPLVLTTDGFVVSYFEKAATLYYLRNGKWHQFILSD